MSGGKGKGGALSLCYIAFVFVSEFLNVFVRIPKGICQKFKKVLGESCYNVSGGIGKGAALSLCDQRFDHS